MSEVAWEDQKKINEFSKLNTQLSQHEQALKNLAQDKELIDDVSLELELVDEDELVPYKIGDALVSLPQKEVMERLEREQEELDEKISKRQAEADACSERMTELKSQLYAKFGKSINLERD